jgi:hypothetical protein
MARVEFAISIPSDVTVEAEPLRFGRASAASGQLTTCGWHYGVSVQPDGSFVAVYEFLDHVGVVRARGPERAVHAVLASARPDWAGDEVIAISQLWD